MSKDFAQIANDVVTGVGLLRQGAPDTMKAFGALSTAARPPRLSTRKQRSLWHSQSASRSTATAASLTTPRWPISMEPAGRKLLRPLPLPSTWEGDRRRSTEEKRCAHMISLPAQSHSTYEGSQSQRGET